MDKRITTLLGAAAALTAMSGAQASPAPSTGLAPATSYRDLLDPIANALPLLKADDARLAEATETQVAQVSIQLGHHHHHHHHHARKHHHHHHNHHHHHDRQHDH